MKPITDLTKHNATIVVPAEDLDITPARGMLHLERCDPDRTAGGLHIPEAAKRQHLARWRVLAVGPAHLLQTGAEVPSLYETGDELFITPSTGTLCEIPGSRQVIASESCVIAKVEVRRQ